MPGDRVVTSDALTVLRRMFAERFATGETAVVDELCAPDLVEHQFGMAGSGVAAIEKLKQAIRDVHTAVPDLTFAIEDAARSGDTVWARVRVQGIASGPFVGPPSGRPVDLTVIDVARVVDGRIVEHWGVPDRFAMLAQTGRPRPPCRPDSRRAEALRPSITGRTGRFRPQPAPTGAVARSSNCWRIANDTSSLTRHCQSRDCGMRAPR